MSNDVMILDYAGPTPADKRLADYERALSLKGWPDHLIKATTDQFDYACFVRGLGVVRFREAAVSGDGAFVRLDHWTNDNGSESRGCFPYPCPRGLEVRVSDLVWVADAPEGS